MVMMRAPINQHQNNVTPQELYNTLEQLYRSAKYFDDLLGRIKVDDTRMELGKSIDAYRNGDLVTTIKNLNAWTSFGYHDQSNRIIISNDNNN